MVGVNEDSIVRVKKSFMLRAACAVTEKTILRKFETIKLRLEDLAVFHSVTYQLVINSAA